MDLQKQERLQKREKFLEHYRAKEMYVAYKLVKRDDQPSTPRPGDHDNKKSWESAVFLWRTAMKESTAKESTNGLDDAYFFEI